MKKALIAMSGGVDSSLAAKPDSQDICFVPDGDYAGVIERHTGRRPVCGNFVDMSGNVLGQHKGEDTLPPPRAVGDGDAGRERRRPHRL